MIRDWSLIKTSSIIFIIVLLLSVGLIASSYLFKENMFSELKKNKSMFIAISQKYLVIDENKKIFKQYYPEFIKLYQQGILGKEHRLHWTETLRASSDHIKLPGLTYSISPQAIYTRRSDINLGNFTLYSSKMTLSINMLHEGDLLRLVEYMNKHARGMFTITACDFTRPSKTLTDNIDATNIKAECALQWFNIRMADGSEIKLS